MKLHQQRRIALSLSQNCWLVLLANFISCRVSFVLRSFCKSTVVVWSDTFPRFSHNSPFTPMQTTPLTSSSSVLAYSFLQLAIISPFVAFLRFYMVVPVSAAALGQIYGHQKGAPYFCPVNLFTAQLASPEKWLFAVKLRVTSAEDFSSDSAAPKVSLLRT